MTKVMLKDGDWYESFDESDGTGACIIFDGARGQYMFAAIIELAQAHGFKLSAEDVEAMDDARKDTAFGDVGATQEVIEISESAEEYLNDQIETAGWMFGWQNGDYFLANEAWWEAAP